MIYSDFLDDDELKAYAQTINQRAKALNKAGRMTVSGLRDRIYESGGRCEWCAVSLLRQPFEVDHIVSLSSGGDNTPDNLAVACPDCNRAKSDKHPARFAQEAYARTGIMTALLRRILDAYDVDAKVQRSLFDADDAPPTIPAPDDDIPDDPPPYVWGE